MRKREIIAAYKKAEQYYENFFPIWGLCTIFKGPLNIREIDVDKYLKPLWEKYRTREGVYHFNDYKERLEAIKKVLNELKTEAQ